MSQIPKSVEHYSYQKALVDLLPENGEYIARKVWESLSFEDQDHLQDLVTGELEPHSTYDGRHNLLNLGLAVKIPYKDVIWYLASTEIGYQVWKSSRSEL